MSRVVYKEVVEFQCVHVHCCRVVIFTRYVQYSECMVMDSIWESLDLACVIKKHNKNALRLKCYNFRRVNAIVFLFSALHTTPFLYGKIHFGILNMLHASIAMSDTPRGSNPP